MHERHQGGKTLAAGADIEDQTTKQWAAQQAEVKAKAAVRGATRTAAKAAKKAIAHAAPEKKTAALRARRTAGNTSA